MQQKGFYIFLTVVLSIYILTNTYIYFRGKEALSLRGWHIWIYRFLFIALVLAYPLGRIIRAVCVCELEHILTIIGSWWLGAMLYLFLSILVVDFLRIGNHFFHFFSNIFLAEKILTGRVLAVSVCTIVSAILIYGYFNALNIRINRVSFERGSPLSKIGMKVVMLSDVHLGIIVDEDRFKKIVDRVNSLNADAVFVVGDLVDENVEKIQEMKHLLSSFKTRLGVYAVTGNHEYYAGVERSVKLMEDSGFHVLRGGSIVVENKFNLLGIDDNTALSFGMSVVPLKTIADKIDNKLPRIFLYHKPIKLNEAIENKIDLMLSGHIHDGQLFPFKFFTNWIYKLPSRNFKIGDTNFFVSSGVGTWGPPMRVLTTPEIVLLDLN